MHDKLDAIIIDPDLDTRMRLKQATSSVHNFGKVYQLGTLKEGIDRLNGSDRCDVIFMSHHFESSEIASFIKAGKESPCGQDAAYILVLKAKDQGSGTVAQSMMIGADGLLFEPYSVDLLIEITNLAAKVKSERSETRQNAAIKILVSELMDQLDQIAASMAKATDVGWSIKKFKEAAAAIPKEGESYSKYLEIGTDLFVNAPAPKLILGRAKYVGASKRMKARADAKKAAQANNPEAAESAIEPLGSQQSGGAKS